MARHVLSWFVVSGLVKRERRMARASDSSSADVICGVSVPVSAFWRTTKARKAQSVAVSLRHSCSVVLSAGVKTELSVGCE